MLQADWGGWRALFEPAVSELPSAQNNPHAEVAYLGVEHSDPLHDLQQAGLQCGLLQISGWFSGQIGAGCEAKFYFYI